MAWLHRTTKQYFPRKSPNDMKLQFPSLIFVGADGNALSNAEWIWNPDLSAVSGVPPRYWNVVGDTVSEMTAAEKAAVDQASADEMRDISIEEAIDEKEETIRQVVRLMLSEINILRAQHGLTARTFDQLRTAIRNGYGS